MPTPGDQQRIPLSTAGLIAPVITLGLLFLFWRLGQKWLAIPVVVAIALYYLLLPRLLRSRLSRFHKESLVMISSGRAAEVPALARRSVFLQLFAPSAPIDAKIGLALTQIGEHARALSHLEKGLTAASASERPALQAALVKSLFVTGDPARTETEALAMLDTGPRLSEVLVAAARARVGLSRLDDRTRSLVDEAERTASSDDVRLMARLTRIEFDLLSGRKAGDIPEGADSTQRFLRAWIHLVRGDLRRHRGDVEGAAESYGRAAREGREQFCWFGAMAHEKLDQLAPAVASGPGSTGAGDTDLDPSLRRKRKKRR